MKLLVDMNISPLCVPALRALGHDAVHWVDIGPPGASDAEIMAWAHQQGSVVLTRDLDFGDMLGASGALGPSVIQLRGDRQALADLAAMMAAALRDHAVALNAGALVTLDVARGRVRLLPIIRPAPLGLDHEP